LEGINHTLMKEFLENTTISKRQLIKFWSFLECLPRTKDIQLLTSERTTFIGLSSLTHPITTLLSFSLILIDMNLLELTKQV
jgi:hypothetical protein